MSNNVISWANVGRTMAVISLIANGLALSVGQPYKDWLIGIAVGFNSASIYIVHNITTTQQSTQQTTEQKSA